MNFRLLLYTSFAFVLLLLWQSWMVYTTPVTEVAPSLRDDKRQQVATPGERPLVPDDQAMRPADDIPARGSMDLHDSRQAIKQKTPSEPADDKIRQIKVDTDVFSIRINTRGGSLVEADLKKIPRRQKDPQPYRLFHSNDGGTYVLQSGLLHDLEYGKEIPHDFLAPSHHAIYQAQAEHYRLGDDAQMRVSLNWLQQDIEVEKVFVFKKGSYLVEMEYWVTNNSQKPWVGRMYTQLRRSDEAPENENLFLYTFTGAAYYDGKYQKQEFSEMKDQPIRKSVVGGWVAMLEHYFLSAIIPDQKESQDYYTKAVASGIQDEYIIGIRSPPLTIVPGEQKRFRMQSYMGPKLQEDLEEIAPGLELTTDYGIFSVISKPLFWLLNKINQWVGNWGVAIILLTILIKLVFYKLSEVSYRSMARMRKFQPQFTRLRDRYKDDREQLNKEIMALYKKEKINPLGGCLPILVQVPVFIALYWVLLESVELRQAPFILWITDLSTRDPFFVLPVLMGLTMFLQNHLNPSPPDPIQAKIMMFLPWIFTVFFAFFPAGLVLYWFANNVISIAQQWAITRQIEKQTK